MASQDQQAAEAELQLAFPSTLQRVDTASTVWDPVQATQWRFSPVASPGASDFFLDLWGRTLTVPREPEETDASYAPRVLREILRPTVTNMGLADAINQGLGITGTEVLDAGSFFTIVRFDEGDIFDDGSVDLVLDSASGLADTPWCCLVVRIYVEPTSPYDFNTIERIVDRNKAAGTRLLAVLHSPTWDMALPGGAALNVIPINGFTL